MLQKLYYSWHKMTKDLAPKF